MKRSKVLLFSVLFIFVLAIAHVSFHFYFFGTGISGFREIGISGLVSGGEDVGEELTGIYSIDMSLSQIFIVFEWAALFFLLVFSYARSRVGLTKEVSSIRLLKEKNTGGTRTDLDRLYDILQDKKRISFSAAAKAFDVDIRVVRDWAETLASAGLITVDYPRIGDPEIVLIEKQHDKEK